MTPDDDPFKKPTRRPYEPKDNDDGYWTRPTLLDRFSNLGFKGNLIWFGGILVTANLISLIFGFYWPRMLILGGAALLVGLLVPRSVSN